MTDSERYARHASIDWFDQQRLRQAQVVVVGTGAVGNEVLKNLALLGVGRLEIFDPDRIERHNLTRAVLFCDDDVGWFKAEVAADRCEQLNPDVEVSYANRDFWEALSLTDLRESDAVVSCVDNFEARIRLNQLCLLMGTDFYNTGIDSRFVSVEAFPFSTDPAGGCYECTLPASVYEAIARRYSCGWLRRAAAAVDKVPTTAVTASLAGSLVVSALLNRLCGHPAAPTGAVRHFQDAVTLHATVSDIRRAAACIGCGRAGLASVHLRAKRAVATECVVPLVGAGAGQVELSEAALIRTTCSACGDQVEVFRSARGLTDQTLDCARCGHRPLDAEFAHSLSVGEFIRLFSGKEVPGKYLTYRQNGETILIELED